MHTDKIDNGNYSESCLRAFLDEQLLFFKTEKNRKVLMYGKKFSKESTIAWLSSLFAMRAVMEIDIKIFKHCIQRKEFDTVWPLDYLEGKGVLIGAYAYRLADYLYWKMPQNDIQSNEEFNYCGYDADRNSIDVDPSTLTPQKCFEEYFVKDSQCMLDHSIDMTQKLVAHYAEGGDERHLSFMSYLSDMISAYPQEVLVIYSAIHCLLEDLSIQQAMTECIEDCEACVNAQTDQDPDQEIPSRMIVADLILKKASDLDIVKA